MIIKDLTVVALLIGDTHKIDEVGQPDNPLKPVSARLLRLVFCICGSRELLTCCFIAVACQVVGSVTFLLKWLMRDGIVAGVRMVD